MLNHRRRAVTSILTTALKTIAQNPNNLSSFPRHHHHHHHIFFFSLLPFSTQSWFSNPGKPLLPWPPTEPNSTSRSEPTRPPPPPPPSEDSSALERSTTAAAAISRLLTKPLSSPTAFATTLDETGIEPNADLLHEILLTASPSPKPTLALFRWATSRPGFRSSAPLITALVDLLAKHRSFAAAWSLLLDDGDSNGSPIVTADAYVALIRRYARAGMPHSAIRTAEFMRDSFAESDHFDLVIDALCKEGHTRLAAEYVARRRAAEPGWSPAVRSYNILLNGWFRSRRLKKAEQIWEEMMRREDANPTVVTYGTMIEGLCRMRRVDQAIGLLEEMRRVGIEPNAITCNPIVDALAEGRRFKEALGMVEKFPLYRISPNISTYNSLVKGFCKNGDLVGASKMLKMMIGRGILPTPTTYNYFFRFFAKFGKVEEGMNLYTKMIQSGYKPDRLTYQLLIKMLCEKEKLDLAVQVIREMNWNGIDSDLATSSMLVHLLCRMHRFEEACEEFEDMFKKGTVPQYLTYHRLVKELKRLGRVEMARKITGLMNSVAHSTKLPNTYRERDREVSIELRESIMKKAQVMSDALKTSKDKNELDKLKSSSEDAVESANKLITDIKRRVYAV